MADIDTLRGDIIDWLMDRTDVVPNVDSFIRLSEADFNRKLRVREMEKVANLTPVVNGSTIDYSLPADFLEWREANTPLGRPLKLVGEDFFVYNRSLNPTGSAKFFVLRGNVINILPEQPDTNLNLKYYSRITSLIDGSNWLYTNHPGAYLFTACRYAARFLGNAELEERMLADSQKEMDMVGTVEDRNRWSKTTTMYQGSRP
jgi:hypothetical protein